MDLFVSRWMGEPWREDLGQECPTCRPSRGSRGRIRIGPAQCRTRNPGPVFWLWTVVCEWPSRQFDSGTIATTDVHHSGASAAEFHRLPDAPKARGRILALRMKASLIYGGGAGWAASFGGAGAPRARLRSSLRALAASGVMGGDSGPAVGLVVGALPAATMGTGVMVRDSRSGGSAGKVTPVSARIFKVVLADSRWPLSGSR